MNPDCVLDEALWDSLPPERRFERPLTVTEEHLDELRHVNNIVYLEWCEFTARQHILSMNMGMETLIALRTVPVALEHRIRYHRPAVLGDRVRVRTALIAGEGVRSTRIYGIERVNAGDNVPVRLVDTWTEWVWVDPLTGRPKRPPPEVRARFAFP